MSSKAVLCQVFNCRILESPSSVRGTWCLPGLGVTVVAMNLNFLCVAQKQQNDPVYGNVKNQEAGGACKLQNLYGCSTHKACKATLVWLCLKSCFIQWKLCFISISFQKMKGWVKPARTDTSDTSESPAIDSIKPCLASQATESVRHPQSSREKQTLATRIR